MADPAVPESSPDPELTRPPATPMPLILAPLTGPPVADMAAAIEQSRRRHEAELAASQRLVAQARAGSAQVAPGGRPESPPPDPGQFRIEVDWRSETAYCVEHDRRVRLECMYWGGPAGSVSHTDGVWEYGDGRREPLTPEERAVTLRRMIEYARTREDIELRIERG